MTLNDSQERPRNGEYPELYGESIPLHLLPKLETIHMSRKNMDLPATSNNFFELGVNDSKSRLLRRQSENRKAFAQNKKHLQQISALQQRPNPAEYVRARLVAKSRIKEFVQNQRMKKDLQEMECTLTNLMSKSQDKTMPQIDPTMTLQ